MRNLITFVFLAQLMSSCQFFETEKISSEETYKEEIQAIDWKDVDQYPIFENCKANFEKAEQRDCFVSTISYQMYESISDKKLVAVREVYDTIYVDFSVSKDGELSIMNIELDSVLQKDYPNLKEWIFKSIDSLELIAPAYKRGIPVKMQFSLPVVIQTD